MRPYKTKRLTEGPDVGDIQCEGRKSSIGKLKTKSGEYKPYTRSGKQRKRIRRRLKRSDKAAINKQDLAEQ